ncbi:unnamed protein product [Toxocara canis]|uniref:Transmembrane protein n=1 Tax=Toxocara canis TaxID=6265 RepID=A0A183UJD4_TOXCA|nr:unnamed protein product [Toxocara canis]
MDEYEMNEPVLPAMCPNSNETFARVHMLFSYHIISWPNFSHCLPHCGMCQMFASDATYNIFNLFLIGFLLPLVGFCGLIGNGLSAFIYSRQGNISFFLGFFLSLNISVKEAMTTDGICKVTA